MSSRKATLGELETLVLLAVLRLDNDASVRRIRREIADQGGRELSRGATYATLSRLERKGFVEVNTKESEAGGRSKHHFTLTDDGLETLQRAQRFLLRMRSGIESLLDLP